jgi:EAL domain-containing protein (putative c-di-GMP-specific phosphodiesterase class I)/FixJ family two-component response regulator
VEEVYSMTVPEVLHASLLTEGVLVVEDSVVQREAVIAQLNTLGITRTWSAADGQLALQLLHTPEVNPAVVCVDLEMPGMDGIEFLQHLHQLDKQPLVIVLSSAKPAILNSVGLMVEALGLLLLAVIQKPLSAEQLHRALLRTAEVGAAPAAERRPLPRMAADDLANALASRRVLPHYQPKVSLRTGEIVGFEALARCLTVTGEVLPPAAFIDTAEQNGLMDTLTLRMLDCVLRDLAIWHANNLFPTVSLNVSASSLVNPLFGQELMQRVDAAQISPTALTLEITESALITDLASAIGMLGRMRLKGFGLSLDDYGTGFSSLQQLDRLPFTELKIDRSFVSQVDRKESRRRILASAVRIGEQLELTTVAEGVETIGELDTLHKLGCEQVQGYLISKPMPSDQVLPWLGAQRARIRQLCRIE